MYVMVVIVLYKVFLVSAQTTVETWEIETTTELVTVITDIPQSDKELALNLDVGTYSTVSFPYINAQYSNLQRDIDKCYDDYTKCLITQGVTHPVCATSDPLWKPQGFITLSSSCDVYFENCKRQMRFWRILDTGLCKLTMHESKEGELWYVDIVQHLPRRRTFEKLPFFLKKIVSSVFK